MKRNSLITLYQSFQIEESISPLIWGDFFSLSFLSEQQAKSNLLVLGLKDAINFRGF